MRSDCQISVTIVIVPQRLHTQGSQCAQEICKSGAASEKLSNSLWINFVLIASFMPSIKSEFRGHSQRLEGKITNKKLRNVNKLSFTNIFVAQLTGAEEKYNFTILTPHLGDLILTVTTMRVILI